MNKKVKYILSILLILAHIVPAWGGTWTSNQFGYKPSLGARGTEEKTYFDTGIDRIDTRLGKEIWVGDPAYGTTLQTAITAIGATPAILRVPAGTHNVAADLSIPATITLRPERGTTFAIATAKTLTINGGLEAGAYPIFSCAGTGKVVFAGQVPRVLPEWWGAAGDGTTNSTAAVLAAAASLPAVGGGVVEFGVGTYSITPGQIVITTPGTILQGRGAATDGFEAVAGTTIKSAAGTGKLIAFQGAAAGTPLDSCQTNDITLLGNNETIQGLSLKWVSNFRIRNLWITKCLDHGVYMEQVWDSSFYDLEVEYCGSQANSKAGLYIYSGTTDNSNNLRFYSFHAECNYGNDVWINAPSTGANYGVVFYGSKWEKNHTVVNPTVKAVHITGWNGATGNENYVTIRDSVFGNYYTAGDIAVHQVGPGELTVDNCNFQNNVNEGTGIKLEGPVWSGGRQIHRITSSKFTNMSTEIATDGVPRAQVWTDGNHNAKWDSGDSRIHINADLVQDRRGLEIASSAVDVATSGTGEDTLGTCTLPANLLGTTGSLKLEAAGYNVGVAGNKTIKLYYGNQAVTVFPAGSIGDWQGWRLEATIRIAGGVSNGFYISWKFTLDGAPSVVSSGWTAGNEATNIDVTVKVTSECANAADVNHMAYWRVIEE